MLWERGAVGRTRGLGGCVPRALNADDGRAAIGRTDECVRPYVGGRGCRFLDELRIVAWASYAMTGKRSGYQFHQIFHRGS